MPVVSDIAIATGGEQVSLLDILEGVSGNDLSFVRKVLEVLDVVAGIRRTDTQMLIPLGPSPVPEYTSGLKIPSVNLSGSFKMLPKQAKTGPCGGTMKQNPNPTASGARGVGGTTTASPAATQTTRRMPKDCTSTDKGSSSYGKTKVIQTQPCPTSTGCTGKERAATISARIGRPKLTGTAITFPFLEDYSEIFGLIVGEDATLVRVDLGTLRATAGLGLKFGPFMAGPVPVDIGIGLSVTFGAHLAMGYDTLGLRNALLTNPGDFAPDSLMDGFYIDDFDASGNETPELTLTLTVQLEGAVSVKIFRVGIYGGVSITIAGDLNDPNNDGRFRIAEMRQFADDPLCLFTLSGWMDFYFGFFVEVDLFIKSFRYDVELWRLKPPLKLFEVKCEPEPPVLAQPDGSNLRLNIGVNAGDRNVSEDKKSEKFRVRQISAVGDANGDGTVGETEGTLVSVEAFGIYQEKVVPKGGAITGNASDENDIMEFLAGVDLAGTTHKLTVPVKVSGGSGDDTIITGEGNDDVKGDEGTDRITLSTGDDKADGGANDDIVGGGLGTDELRGGEGNDNLSGDAGADKVWGDAGNDTVSGGPGLSAAEYDRAKVRQPSLSADVKDGADRLVGGTGSDQITGHVGNDVIFGDGEVSSGTFRSDACAGNAAVDGAGDSVDGQLGNDWVAGGGGPDSLTGGEGDDTICGNGGDDLLEAETGPGGTTVGSDELRGGDGHDRLLGRQGGDYAEGGAGDDLVDAGTGNDVAIGNAGSDAMTGADGNDIVTGDGATVSGISFQDSIEGGRAGVASLGNLSVTSGTALESRVSSADASGTDGSITTCTDRVALIRNTALASGPRGEVDLNGDGTISGADDGRLDGVAVLNGLVNLDGDGDIDGDDSGVVAGLVVGAGRFDVPVNQAVQVLGSVPGSSGAGDADCVFGHSGHDAVFGGAGGDQLNGGAGADLAAGGAGADTARGEADADEVRGNDGDDDLFGDSGADLLLGNAGADEEYGGLDIDQVEGNQGSDTLSGGAHVDIVIGGSSVSGTSDAGDRVDGGDGADVLLGDNGAPVRSGLGVLLGAHLTDVPGGTAAGADEIHGGPGDDLVYGEGGGDTVFGDEDADTVEGGLGSDEIHGGDGLDLLVGGSGRDRNTDGTERTWQGTADDGDTIHGDADEDVILGDNGVRSTGGTVTMFDIPFLDASPAPSATTAGDDVLNGGDDADRIYGQSGRDTVHGNADDDVAEGNSGADDVYGDAGEDDLFGGTTLPEVDDRAVTVSGTSRGDLVEGGTGDDVALGDNGLVSGDDRDVEEYDVEYAASTERFLHASGPDTILGQDDEDRLFGQGGDDRIDGGAADDLAAGDTGDDTINGGEGADDLTGGSGLAQVPVDLAGVIDGRDDVNGGGTGLAAADGADVILGDNGSITRTGDTDPNTGDAVRTVLLYDLDVAGDTAAPEVGSGGSDTLDGDGERDLVHGQAGLDIINGGDGDDWLEGNAAEDTVHGDAGDDDALGGSSAKVVDGGDVGGLVGEPGTGNFPTQPNALVDGDDEVWGDAGNDAVAGDNGRIDRAATWAYQGYLGGQLLIRTVKLAGIAEHGDAYGDDTLHGNDGHDEVYGALGDDLAEGNAGDDSVLGDLGLVTTSVNGGTGPGTLISADGFIQDRVDVPGTLRRTTTLYPNVASVTNGGAGGADTLLGGLGDDVLHGGAGNDTAWGNRSLGGTSGEVPTAESTSAADDDVLFGDHGNDRIWGGWEHDHLYGGHGADLLDVVTDLRNGGDPEVDFKGMDFMYGGWGADGMQADWSKPSPDHGTDKMVDGTGSYNGYFVCEGAYGGNSVMRLLSPAMQKFWQRLAAGDGALGAATTGSSGWWELSMVFNGDRSANANPVYDLNPAHFVCDSTP